MIRERRRETMELAYDRDGEERERERVLTEKTEDGVSIGHGFDWRVRLWNKHKNIRISNTRRKK